MDDIEDVIVVGGGDVGLLTALALRNFNDAVEISVIDDFEEEQPQVGKSTFKAILSILHTWLGIDEEEFLQEVKPIFKATVYFRDWCGYQPFHHPFDIAQTVPDLADAFADRDLNFAEMHYFLYDEVYRNPEFRTRNEVMAEEAKTPFTVSVNNTIEESTGNFAYHLNTNRFNSFLRTLCQERDIELIDDRITSVEVGGRNVQNIAGKTTDYQSDLYIDASGFNRILKREFDSAYRQFEIPLNRAFNTQVDRPLSEIIPATVVESGEAGWFWQIDTYDNRDIGYVYASEHLDEGDARTEFLDHFDLDGNDTEMDKYEFSSGYFEEAWEGNCISIGNAEGFIEPLQSTGLTASAQAAGALAIFLTGHDWKMHEGIRESFNRYVSSSWESIYDFIFLHYKFSSGDNAFWETMRSMEGSARAREIIKQYNQNGIMTAYSPEKTGASAITYGQDIWNMPVFPLAAHYSIMRKMGAESDFYENNDFTVSDEIRQHQARVYESFQDEVDLNLTHEQFYQVLG